MKILLDKVNVAGINSLDVYRANGGYASVEKALRKMTSAKLRMPVSSAWQ